MLEVRNTSNLLFRQKYLVYVVISPIKLLKKYKNIPNETHRIFSEPDNKDVLKYFSENYV